MKIKMMALVALLAGTGAISVEAAKARIDINSNNKIELEAVCGPDGGHFNNIDWGDKEKQDFALFGETDNLSNDKWSTVSFKFLPLESGKVEIWLKGNYTKSDGKKFNDQNWVYFDDVKVEGATMINGDFEEEYFVNAEPMPKGWGLNPKAVFVKDKSKSAQGNNCVKVWHNCMCTQVINVEKGKEVTITVTVKGGETVLSTE